MLSTLACSSPPSALGKLVRGNTTGHLVPSSSIVHSYGTQYTVRRGPGQQVGIPPSHAKVCRTDALFACLTPRLISQGTGPWKDLRQPPRASHIRSSWLRLTPRILHPHAATPISGCTFSWMTRSASAPTFPVPRACTTRLRAQHPCRDCTPRARR